MFVHEIDVFRGVRKLRRISHIDDGSVRVGAMIMNYAHYVVHYLSSLGTAATMDHVTQHDALLESAHWVAVLCVPIDCTPVGCIEGGCGGKA